MFRADVKEDPGMLEVRRGTTIGRATGAVEFDRAALAKADHAEGRAIRRFGRSTSLRDAIDEAARRADVRLGLDIALRCQGDTGGRM